MNFRSLIVIGGALIAAIALAAPAQAAPQCGDEITHDTVLKHSLECDPGTDGLEILADDITLDLGGHTISADPQAGFAGVAVTGASGTKITGGRIRGFSAGTSIFESDHATVSHLKIKNAQDAQVDIGLSGQVKVAHNTFGGPLGQGVRAEGLTAHVTVADNVLDQAGIELVGNKHKVTDNVIKRPDGPGIEVGEADRAVLRDNRIENAKANGAGISLSSDAGKTRVQGNLVDHAQGGGIVASSNAGPVKEIANTVRQVDFNGFFVATNASVVLRRNVAERAGSDGIHVDDDDTLIEDNYLFANEQLGINSDSANGSGNVAKRNGIHPQCVPQSLCVH